MEAQEKLSESDRRVWPWPTALNIAVFFAVVMGGSSGLRPSGIPFLLGSSFTLSGVIWLITYFGFLKRTRAVSGGYAFGVLYAATFISSVFTYAFTEVQADRARSGLRESYEQFQKGGTIDESPTATGDYGRMEGLSRSLMKSARQLQIDYQIELEPLRIAEILTPENLRADRDLVESERRTRQARAVVEKYHDRATALIVAHRKAIEDLPVDYDRRRLLLAELDRGEARVAPMRDRVWDIDAEVMAEYQSLVALLKASKGRWQVQADRVMFENDADLEAYNRHQANMDRLATEQEKLTKTLNDQMAASVKP